MEIKEGDKVRYQLEGVTGFGVLKIDEMVLVIKDKDGNLQLDSNDPYININPNKFRNTATITLVNP